MTQMGTTNSKPMLMFGLSGETIALDASLVRAILDPVPVTRIPGSREFVRGVINVRGNVVPMADLRLQLGMVPSPITLDTRFIVIEIDIGSDATTIGVVAEKVFEVTEIAAGSLLEKPSVGLRWKSEFISSMGKWKDDVFIVPDMSRIFNS